jgi:hypothetical protein
MILTKRSQSWMDKTQKTMLSESSKQLLAGRAVEVGYRSTCGSKDNTHKEYEIFYKLIKSLRSQGVSIRETPVKHGNAYATNNGGFWNSTIFEVEE